METAPVGHLRPRGTREESPTGPCISDTETKIKDDEIAMSWISWMFKPYRDYGVISGRSRRKEYWLFVMF